VRISRRPCFRSDPCSVTSVVENKENPQPAKIIDTGG
jgi:hypothetical protein